MANGSTALAAMEAECLSAIVDIKASSSPLECEAHLSIARGLIALLRCQVAQCEADRQSMQDDRQFVRSFFLRVLPYIIGAAGAIVGGAVL